MLQVIKAEDVRDGEPRLWIERPQDHRDAPSSALHTGSRRDVGCQSCEFAIVDRPAPSTAVQPPPVLDLDALAEAERAMTAGTWEVHRDWPRVIVASGSSLSLLGLDVDETAIIYEEGDAAGIVALRNAAPHLIAEARAAVALRQELAAMAERLAEAKRLGLEACGLSDEGWSYAGDYFTDKHECGATAAIRAALEAM